MKSDRWLELVVIVTCAGPVACGSSSDGATNDGGAAQDGSADDATGSTDDAAGRMLDAPGAGEDAAIPDSGGGTSTGDSTVDDSGVAPCDIVECFRAVECVTTCGGPVVSSGCCPCVAPTFDSFSCSARD